MVSVLYRGLVNLTFSLVFDSAAYLNSRAFYVTWFALLPITQTLKDDVKFTKKQPTSCGVTQHVMPSSCYTILLLHFLK